MLAANIVVGAPSLVKIGAYGGGVGAAADIGSTEGGLKIISAPEWYWHTADQWVGKVGATKLSEDFIAEVIVAEPTLANLALGFGYPTGAVSGGDTLDVGGSDTATIREMFITGKGPRGSSRLITVHKMVITGSTDVALIKSDKTGIKLTIQILQDTGKAANKQCFSVVDSAWDDSTAPTVVMTSPVEDAEIASGGKVTVTLTFTEDDSAMDEGSLIYGNADNATVFINNITDSLDTSLVLGKIVYNAATKTLVFTPDENWEVDKDMQIIITTGVRDTQGNHLASAFFGHFTTAA